MQNSSGNAAAVKFGAIVSHAWNGLRQILMLALNSPNLSKSVV